MHRIFAALPVPEEVSSRLIPLRADLHGARWRRPDQFHITLQFYGAVALDVAEEIANALERIEATGFELSLEGVGWFGRKEPHSVYARIADTAALTNLAERCRKIAAQVGVKLDAKPFKPHITLAYCKDTPLADVMAWSEDFQVLRSAPFHVDAFNLYESFTAVGRPSRYQIQARYPLK